MDTLKYYAFAALYILAIVIALAAFLYAAYAPTLKYLLS